MEIYIDDREKYLKKVLSNKQFVKIKHLDIGDIQYIDTESENFNQILLIIERKSLEDLCASVKYSRIKEQKYRLKKLKQDMNISILYIFEGANYTTQSLPKSTILSCIINTSLRDKICTLQTKNERETMEYILKIYMQLQKYDITSNYMTNYNEILKFNKKKLDPIQCFIGQLCQIPGISNKIAIGISKNFCNMSEFISYLEGNEKKNLIKLQILPNRKMGPKLTQNIYEYLFSR